MQGARDQSATSAASTFFSKLFKGVTPGEVLVIDNGGRLDEACVGDIVAIEDWPRRRLRCGRREVRVTLSPVEDNGAADSGESGNVGEVEERTLGFGHKKMLTNAR